MAEVSKRRIVFMGTPSFAANILNTLIDSKNYEIVAIYTRPDKKAGRGMKTAFSEVKKIALNNNLPLYQPSSFKKEETVKELASLKPDYLVVAAYGLILPQQVLDIPKMAPINVHSSLLPALRGAAPIQRAIMENPEKDAKTGVSIMKMVTELDAGPVYVQKEVEIGRKDYKSLEEELSHTGALLLLEALNKIEKNKFEPIPQDECKKSYARKLEKNEGQIDWTKKADEIDALVRAVSYWPGAKTDLSIQSVQEKIPVTVLSGTPGEESDVPPGTIMRNTKGLFIACQDRWYKIEKLKPQGRKAMSGTDFANGQIKISQGICGQAISKI